MKLKISRSKNSCNLYVQKAFRDKSGKSTSKIVERLGSLDEVRQRAGGRDPMEWAKEYVARLTAQEKEQSRVIMPRLHPARLIEKGEAQSCGCGYLFLKQIYHQIGLDRICRAIGKRHGYRYDLDAVLQMLVFGRVMAPASKTATLKAWQSQCLEKVEVDDQHVFRALDVLAEEDTYIQRRLFLNSRKIVSRDTTVLYYDCTNYFFETEEADPEVELPDGTKKPGLRQYGPSKEHRPNPVVQMGMFIDNSGYPLAMCIHPGNNSEQNTLVPLEKDIIEGMGVERVVVCTDGGLSSEDNRAFNSTAERSFITVQSLKKLTDAYKDWALQAAGWRMMPPPGEPPAPEKADIEYDLADEQTARRFKDRTFWRERWIKNEATGFEQRMIVTFSFKYRDYLRWLRNRQIARAEKMVKKGTSGKRRPNSADRYIAEIHATAEGELAVYKTMALNLDAISEEERYDGFYAICTDLSNPASEIIALNHNRWESEDAFRVIKTDFRGRPAFVWTDEHIKAHFLTCFIALLIYRILEKRLPKGTTSPQLLATLRSMTLNIIKGEGYKPNYTRTDLTDALHEQAGFRTDTEIITNSTIKSILRMVKES